jgi:hypothetical protein
MTCPTIIHPAAPGAGNPNGDETLIRDMPNRLTGRRTGISESRRERETRQTTAL